MPFNCLSIADCIAEIKKVLKLSDDSHELTQLNTLLQQIENSIIDINGIGRGHWLFSRGLCG